MRSQTGSMVLFLIGLMLLGMTPSMSAADKPEPTSPTEDVIKLFNGKDLTGLYVFMRDTKYEDPRRIFTVHDGLLHISGDGFGGICTKKEYSNYHMICEFKWV